MWLVDKWTLKGHDMPPGMIPRVIVAISYVTGRTKLMNATGQHFVEALVFAAEIDDSGRICVAHSCCSYPFSGAEQIEHDLKHELIQSLCCGRDVQIVEGVPMINTVVEAQNIKHALCDVGIAPATVLVVTSQAHSRSAYWIYTRLFPKAEIYLKIFPFENEYQEDRPIPDQRYPWKWFIMNVLRQCALWVFGLNFVAKIKRAVPKGS